MWLSTFQGPRWGSMSCCVRGKLKLIWRVMLIGRNCQADYPTGRDVVVNYEERSKARAGGNTRKVRAVAAESHIGLRGLLVVAQQLVVSKQSH